VTGFNALSQAFFILLWDGCEKFSMTNFQFGLNALVAALPPPQCYPQELRIFGKIFRAILPNDK
jgi:hypothetical protein